MKGRGVAEGDEGMEGGEEEEGGEHTDRMKERGGGGLQRGMKGWREVKRRREDST